MAARTQHPWFDGYDPWVPKEIEFDSETSVRDLIEEAMQRFAGVVCIECNGQRVTFEELDTMSIRLAGHLQAMGLKKGERVAVVLANSIEFVVVLMACIRAGFVQVNVNPHYTARELVHQITDADVSAVFFSAIAKEALATVSSKLRQTTMWVRVGGKESSSHGPEVQFANLLEQNTEHQFSPPCLTTSDLLFLQYTGGTTGAAKGVMLTHGNIVATMKQCEVWYGSLLPVVGARVLTALPLYHIFALCVNCLTRFWKGASNVLITNTKDIGEMVAAFVEHPCHVFTGVNTLYANLLQAPGLTQADFSQLVLCLGGGAPILPAVSEKWHKLTGHHIQQGYGLSESAGTVSINPISRNSFNGSVGLPLPSTDVRIVDAEGAARSSEEAGELCVSGPQITCGYWRRAETSAAEFTTDGFFRTGDIATMSQDGFIWILDRKSDVILVSGFNVYPAEVEKIVSDLDHVVECACVGVDDARTGQAVRIFVVEEVPGQLSQDAIYQHCRKLLAAYKRPTQVKFVSELPKSSVGKVLRRVLRQQS